MTASRYLAIVLATAPLWGGVRIKIDGTDLKTNEVSQQEVLLDSNRLRVNMNVTGKSSDKQSSVLFLTDNGRNRMVMLDRPTNEYREIDQQTMNQVSQQLQGALGQLQAQLQNMPPEQRARIEQMMKGRGLPGAAAPPAAPRNTFIEKGSGSVNGFSCTKYEEMRGAEKIADICSAKPADLHLTAADFQVFDQMKQFAASMLSSLTNVPLGAVRIPDILDQGTDGFPIQRIVYSGGQATGRYDVKSVDRSSFSDADFSLGNAKKLELIPGRRAQ